MSIETEQKRRLADIIPDMIHESAAEAAQEISRREMERAKTLGYSMNLFNRLTDELGISDFPDHDQESGTVGVSFLHAERTFRLYLAPENRGLAIGVFCRHCELFAEHWILPTHGRNARVAIGNFVAKDHPPICEACEADVQHPISSEVVVTPPTSEQEFRDGVIGLLESWGFVREQHV